MVGCANDATDSIIARNTEINNRAIIVLVLSLHIAARKVKRVILKKGDCVESYMLTV